MKRREKKKILETIVILGVAAGVIEIIALFFFGVLLEQQKARMIIGITLILTAIIGLISNKRLRKTRKELGTLMFLFLF